MDGFMMRHGKSEECAAEYRREWGQDDSDEGEGESIGNGAESVRNEHSGATKVSCRKQRRRGGRRRRTKKKIKMEHY